MDLDFWADGVDVSNGLPNVDDVGSSIEFAPSFRYNSSSAVTVRWTVVSCRTIFIVRNFWPIFKSFRIDSLFETTYSVCD